MLPAPRIRQIAPFPALALILALTMTLILTGLAGCGSDNPPALAPLPPGAVVLAFGDSLTAGYGAGPGQSYPEQLARLTGLDVRGSGIPGEISARGLARLPGELARTRPDLVILCHGGNDMLRGLPASVTEANLKAMVALIRDRGAQVLLVGLPRPGLSLSTSEIYDRVAEEARVPLARDALTDIYAEASLKADPIHPNSMGYARLASVLAEMLRSAQ